MTRAQRLGAVAASLMLAGGAAVAPAAHADFTPDTLVSGSQTVEADDAFDPVISGDGRYVVFTGSQAGVAGIYRKDLQTSALDLVAGAGAGGPSISADGRYVSFTTSATTPGDGTGHQCSSVYVRDMSVAIGAPGAYTLASARDHATMGLTYAGSSKRGCLGGGASAAAGTALSSSGRKVAFTIVGASDLGQAVGVTKTPGAQVAVRSLDTNRTMLVSQTAASLGATPEPVPAGGALTDNSTGTGKSSATADAAAGDSSASISADGTTVAWMGINIPQQAPASAADAPHNHANEYDEPLWRRIADGAAAPTRRVLGGDDPAGPCPGSCAGPLDTQWDGPSNPTIGEDQGPERGSLISYDGFNGATSIAGSVLADATPQLSADGRTVAILSTQPATGQDPVYSTSTPQNVSANAFVVNMASGLSRSQALTRLTAWASTNFDDLTLAGPIEHLAISPEGNRIAFVTRRTVFPFSPPALISPQLSDVTFDQLYVANLTDGTLELASSGLDGQPANGFVTTPSFSLHGGPIAFASSATNLVYGAFSSVTGGTEAFTITQLAPPAIHGMGTIGAAPLNPTVAPAWAIGATIRRTRTGVVQLDVTVPGAGRLSAAARSALPRNGGRRRRAHGRRSRAVSTVVIARAAAKPATAGVVALPLRPPTRYRSAIARTRHGLYAIVTVTFAAPGRRPLKETLPFAFRRAPVKRASKGPR